MDISRDPETPESADAAVGGSALLEVTVDEVVMLGPVSEVRCRAGDLAPRAIVPDREAEALAPQPGETLGLTVPPDAVYAFPGDRAPG